VRVEKSSKPNFCGAEVKIQLLEAFIFSLLSTAFYLIEILWPYATSVTAEAQSDIVPEPFDGPHEGGPLGQVRAVESAIGVRKEAGTSGAAGSEAVEGDCRVKSA